MLFRFLWVGLMAGILAGLPAAAVQHVTTTPLIIAAEAYENAEAEDKHAAYSERNQQFSGGIIQANVILVHGTASEHADETWAPDDGLERTFFTFVSTILTTIGYSFMLLAIMFLAKSKITPRTGLMWGLAGFVATGLAPSLGLSPELPGAAAGDLMHRQIWWGSTAILTAGGLWLILRVSKLWAIALGAILICLPHFAGAPFPEELTSEVPSELAAHFASSALVLHAITWVLAGAAVGFLWNRQGQIVDE